ncbi:MAG: hypothetical protein JXJ20_08810 [Anaerolineae bacterium]|jgi:hypothetical protein|nr:hypothetical protein [Anaerolineae bacterium]
MQRRAQWWWVAFVISGAVLFGAALLEINRVALAVLNVVYTITILLSPLPERLMALVKRWPRPVQVTALVVWVITFAALILSITNLTGVDPEYFGVSLALILSGVFLAVVSR